MKRNPVREVRNNLSDIILRGRQFRLWLAGVSFVLLVISVTSLSLSESEHQRAVTSLAGYLYWFGIGGGCAILLAILRLTRAEWRRPLTRIAELLTVLLPLSVILYPLAFLWQKSVSIHHTEMLYESVRWIWNKWKYAWVIDLTIAVPMFTVILFLFWRCIMPDIQKHRQPMPGGKLRTYSSFLIVLTVSGLAWFGYGFGMTRIPGWESTLFGPYMVGTSLLHGAAAIVVLSVILRRALGLDRWLTPHHLDHIARLMIGLLLIWFYLNFAEFLTVWYGHIPREMAILLERTITVHPALFGFVIGTNFIIPLVYFSFPGLRRSVWGVFIISSLILIGGFAEWALLFTPAGIIVDYTSFGGMLLLPAIFGLILTVILAVIPPISIWELEEGIIVRGSRRLGERVIATYILTDIPEQEISHVIEK